MDGRLTNSRLPAQREKLQPSESPLTFGGLFLCLSEAGRGPFRTKILRFPPPQWPKKNSRPFRPVLSHAELFKNSNWGKIACERGTFNVSCTNDCDHTHGQPSLVLRQLTCIESFCHHLVSQLPDHHGCGAVVARNPTGRRGHKRSGRGTRRMGMAAACPVRQRGRCVGATAAGCSGWRPVDDGQFAGATIAAVVQQIPIGRTVCPAAAGHMGLDDRRAAIGADVAS